MLHYSVLSFWMKENLTKSDRCDYWLRQKLDEVHRVAVFKFKSKTSICQKKYIFLSADYSAKG